jgi:hypothetical protein
LHTCTCTVSFGVVVGVKDEAELSLDHICAKCLGSCCSAKPFKRGSASWYALSIIIRMSVCMSCVWTMPFLLCCAMRHSRVCLPTSSETRKAFPAVDSLGIWAIIHLLYARVKHLCCWIPVVIMYAEFGLETKS